MHEKERLMTDGDIRQSLGGIWAEIKAARRDIKELKELSKERSEWERIVESRLAVHDTEIRNLKERSIHFRDTAPSLKITITAGGILGAIGVLIAALVNAGVHP